MISATHDDSGSRTEPARESAFDVLERDRRRRVRRNWLVLTILPALGAVLLTAYRVMQPPEYEAEGQIRITHGLGALPDIPDVSELDLEASYKGLAPSMYGLIASDFENEIAMLSTSDFKRRVLLELPPAQREQLARELRPTRLLARTSPNSSLKSTALLRNGVRISGDADSAIVHITDDSTNPTLSAELVNATIRAAIHAGTEAALARSRVLESFFAPQVAALEDRIHEEEAEEKALGISGNRGASRDALSFATPPEETSLARLTGAAGRAELKQRLEAARMRLLTALQPGDPGAFDITADDGMLEELRDSLGAARRTYAEMAVQLGPNNPEMQAAAAEIAALEQAVEQQRRTDVRHQAGLADLGRRQAFALRRQADAGQQALSAVRDAQRSSALLEIDLLINLTVLADLRKKLLEYPINASLSALQVEVVDYAQTPDDPIGFSLSQMLSLGALAGTVLAASIISVLQYRTRRRWSLFSLENAVGRPVLALLQQVAGTGPAVPLPARLGDPLREVRSALAVMRGGKASMTVAFTCSHGGEGTTTLTTALALLLAQSGERVLLIDANLYHPGVRRQLALTGATGLSQLLTGGATLDEAVQRLTVQGGGRLDVITAGPPAPVPAELLNSVAFDTMLRQTRESYGYILLDTAPAGAPLGLPSTAQIDALLLIARFGTVDLRQVRFTERRLFAARAPLMAALINGVPQGRLRKE